MFTQVLCQSRSLVVFCLAFFLCFSFIISSLSLYVIWNLIALISGISNLKFWEISLLWHVNNLANREGNTHGISSTSEGGMGQIFTKSSQYDAKIISHSFVFNSTTANYLNDFHMSNNDLICVKPGVSKNVENSLDSQLEIVIWLLVL